MLFSSCLHRYSFQLVFQLVFPSYTLQLPSICVRQIAFKKFCSNNGELLTLQKRIGISQTYQATYLLCGHMEVPHLISIRSMECWLATLNASSAIMSHAFGKNKAARIGVICQSVSSKLSTSCLHGYSVTENQAFFYFFPGGDIIRNTPNCPGRNNLHFALALENEG